MQYIYQFDKRFEKDGRYTAFVFFRTTGFVFEDFPSTGILIAYFVELVIALVGVFLMKTRRQALSGR
jgi:hypothetical protein